MWRPGKVRPFELSAFLRRLLVVSTCVVSPVLGQEPTEGAGDNPAADTAPAPVGQELNAAERAALIARLREAYSKPASEWPKPDLDQGIPHREIGAVEDWKLEG